MKVALSIFAVVAAVSQMKLAHADTLTQSTSAKQVPVVAKAASAPAVGPHAKLHEAMKHWDYSTGHEADGTEVTRP